MYRDTFEANIEDFASRFRADDRLYVVFSMGTVRDEWASKAAGRPIYKDAEFVRIMIPGDKHSVIERPATDEDKQRFKRQYEGFKTGNEDTLTGTPLEQWPLVSKAQVEEFRFLGVRTVDQLADLRDDVVMKIPGAAQLKTRAKSWLEASKGSGELERLQSQIDADKGTIEELKATLASQAEVLKALQSEFQARAPRRADLARTDRRPQDPVAE
jgi:hypothetical protein